MLQLEAGSYSWTNPTTDTKKVFTGKYLVAHGLCQLQNDLYSWGFSFMLLFTFTLTTFVFSMIWAIVAFKHHSRIKPWQVDMAFGDLHTALVVSRSVSLEFGGDVERALERGLPLSRSIQQLQVRGDSVGTAFITRPKPDSPPETATTNYAVHSEAYETYLRKNNRPEYNLKRGFSQPQTTITETDGH